MTPEAFAAEKADTRAGIFSLGVLAYELFLGRRPFVGGTLAQVVASIQTALLVEPRIIEPTFSLVLQCFLGKMLKIRKGVTVQPPKWLLFWMRFSWGKLPPGVAFQMLHWNRAEKIGTSNLEKWVVVTTYL